jgi:predicted GNAT superfamily acetyltransferase
VSAAIDTADTASVAAAAAAGVEIVEVASPDELDVLRSTMDSIWGPEIVPPRNLLRGLALSGNCLLVARRDDEPVGFALGWLGWDGGVHFHSHQVGVQTGTRGGGVGFALKLAQRALCLRHGMTEMRWTFDPMLFSNARFNLVRLGARVVGVLPHCYGDRRDAFNTGERTDRLEVSWRLDAPIGAALVAPEGRAVVTVPADYATWRLTDPVAAAAERARVTDHLVSAMAAGRRVVGLSADGYVLGEVGSSGEVGP